ncbi:hypothetical protein SAMN05443144_12264 [Fodinibius roseus]|uniref:Uncharacterized protein n=1 Tax=Fodinibius roseus TaxID=1194090 RepID=A0A1M5I7T4_9BACT|nr:hypothetical protein SAMN05443144_12264 [Fodinibius roseus]
MRRTDHRTKTTKEDNAADELRLRGGEAPFPRLFCGVVFLLLYEH